MKRFIKLTVNGTHEIHVCADSIVSIEECEIDTFINYKDSKQEDVRLNSFITMSTGDSYQVVEGKDWIVRQAMECR